MMDALALDSRSLALELHALLRDLDPARWRDEAAAGIRERVSRLDTAIRALLARTWPEQGSDHPAAALARAFEQVHLAFTTFLAADPTPGHAREACLALRAQLQPTYDAAAAGLVQWGIPLPHEASPGTAAPARPRNYARNAFHFAWACVVLVGVGWVLTRPQLVVVGVLGVTGAWGMEIGRRLNPGVNRALMAAFGPFAHAHEADRVNSATWYTTALFLLSLFAPTEAGIAAIAVLGVGDPSAAIVGRRFGRTRLANGRSLEGTAAFVACAGTFAFLALRVFQPDVPATAAVLLAGTAATAGALAELFARRIDDNLAIPIAAAIAATAVQWAVLP